MARKQKTREKILTIALTLFNENGSHKTTTNHIAKAAGISPGNLYYHFKNKEHIIRELLARLIEEFDSIMDIQDKGLHGLELVARAIKDTADVIFVYRFIYIELASLISNDDAFEAMYRDIKVRRAKEFRLYFDYLSQLGLLQHPVQVEEGDAIVFILWTYAEGIVTTLLTSGIPVTRTAIFTHFTKIAYLLKPFLQADVWAQLAQALELE